MARISGTAGPSHADVAKETTTLIQQGKIKPGGTQLNEWLNWKSS
jgi:hypothetical protein